MYKNSRVKSDNDLISVSLAKIPSVEMTIEVHTFRKYREHELWSNLSLNRNGKERCEITIISFSRSICRGGLAALIGVTGKSYPSCLSCHSHPIRPCGHLPLEGKAAIREYHLLKKGGEAATRALNPEPNESKVKRGCEEMRIHFFTAPFLMALRKR